MKIVFSLDRDWAKGLIFCKVLQNRPKRVLGPGNQKGAELGLDIKMEQLWD